MRYTEHKWNKKGKHFMLLCFIGFIGFVLVVRLFQLTVLQKDKWSTIADEISCSTEYETAPRGKITDRNGITMAESEGVVQEENTGIYGEKTAKIDYIRKYPNGTTGSHILGYLGRLSREDEEEYDIENGYQKDSLIGKSGIEKECEKRLKGQDAVTVYRVDSTGKRTGIVKKTKAVKGEDIKLTIDLELQKTAEEALQKAIKQASLGGTFDSDYGKYNMIYAPNAKSGAAVAVNVKTGEILALASLPQFNPNDFVSGITQKKWKQLQKENEYDTLSPSPLYNIAVMTAVQPGSTFKPITALTALECGLDEEEKLYDNGRIMTEEGAFGCYLWNEKKSTHGYVDMKKAMEVSCNYYFYDIAAGKDFATSRKLNYNKKISNELIVETAQKFGLGMKTGIETGESVGSVPTESEKEKNVISALRTFLYEEQETYFKEELLNNREIIAQKIEKISKWAYKDLTLDEIICKLKREKCIKNDYLEELAEICQRKYYSSMKWSIGDTFNTAIGQGGNAYTALQMAQYMATLGNYGHKNKLTLIADSDRKNVAADIGCSRSSIESVIDAMTAVTQGESGSLKRCFNDFPYVVAAKTGTAQREGKKSVTDEKEYIRNNIALIAPGISVYDVEKEAGRLMEAYPDYYTTESKAWRRSIVNLSQGKINYQKIDCYKDEYDNFAWTVAIAPAKEPQIAVAVMLIQGKSSGNAAPVAREIIGKYGEISKWKESF